MEQYNVTGKMCIRDRDTAFYREELNEFLNSTLQE